MFDYIKFDIGSLRILICVMIILAFGLLLNFKRHISSVFNVVLIYILCGFISSILFYGLSKNQWYSFDESVIQYEPLLYLVILFLIMALPFLYILPKKYQGFDDEGIEPLLNVIAILLFLSSLFPFFYGLISLFSLNYNSIVSSYEGRGVFSDNPIVYYSNQFRNYLKFFISPLLFYYIYKGCEYRKYLFFVVFSLVTTVLLSLVGGGRGTMVNEVNYLVICYLLFAHLITPQNKKKIKKQFVIFIAAVVVSLTVITFARSNFSSSNASEKKKADLITWVFLYLGQGPLEFSRQMYPSTVRTEGDNSFSLVKTAIGLKTFKENNDRREYWAEKQEIDNFIFYTVIGDIYSDLGYEYTIIFFLGISIVMCLYFKSGNSFLSIHKVVIASMYFEWLTMGFMTNCYKTYYSQFFILITLIILFILFVYNRKAKVY